MKFEIHRVTDTRGESPCKNAKAEVVQKTYFANYKDMENNIKSERDAVEWYIEIDSIEDLNALIEEVGEIIIYRNNRITIYDDYIE